MDIPGDMDIGVAAGPMSLAAAGEPPVFSIRLGLIIQPDLETLDIAVPVAARHQKPRMAEDVPVSPVNIEARDAHDKRMNDCLPPILFSAIFKLLKVLPDTELDAC